MENISNYLKLGFIALIFIITGFVVSAGSAHASFSRRPAVSSHTGATEDTIIDEEMSPETTPEPSEETLSDIPLEAIDAIAANQTMMGVKMGGSCSLAEGGKRGLAPLMILGLLTTLLFLSIRNLYKRRDPK